MEIKNKKTINNTQNNNLIINNITLNFGDEILPKLTNAEQNELFSIKPLEECIYMLPHCVYFNPNYPQNHTAYINNLNSKYMNVMNNGKLIAIEKNIALAKIAHELSLDLQSYIRDTRRLSSQEKKIYYNVCDEHTALNFVKKNKYIYEKYNIAFFNGTRLLL